MKLNEFIIHSFIQSFVYVSKMLRINFLFIFYEFYKKPLYIFLIFLYYTQIYHDVSSDVTLRSSFKEKNKERYAHYN